MYTFLTIQDLNWTNVVTGIIGALFSIVGIYLNDKLKNKKKVNDDFQALIDANTKYREEIRKDLILSKEEIKAAWIEIEESRKIIKQLEIKNQFFEDQIRILTSNIEGQNGLREKLRRCEDRFLNISNATPSGIFRIDKNGECIFVNKRWCQLTGLKAEDAMGNGWKTAIHPDDYKQFIDSWDESLKTHSGFKIISKLLNKNGKIITVECGAIREECKDNLLIGYVGYLIEHINGNTVGNSDTVEHTSTIEHTSTVEHINTVEHSNTIERSSTVEHNI